MDGSRGNKGNAILEVFKWRACRFCFYSKVDVEVEVEVEVEV
jgi:hypothetical protein